MDEYISKTELLKVINTDIREAHNERCAQILEAISNAPTADVVLKSEVDFLCKTITENAQKALEVTLEEVEKAKAEVVREIFEEIENKLTEEAKDILERINSITDPDAVDGLYEEVATLEIVLAWLAELKKKYLEEKE